MKRKQVFEWTDLPWWPQFARNLLTDFLRTYTELVDPFAPLLSKVAAAIESGTRLEVVDLCAGSGGPWKTLLPKLEQELRDTLQVTLTDLFPPESLIDLPDRVRLYPGAVDARNVPGELRGTRMMVDAFHHFEPNDATQILASSVASREPIVILEILRRTPGDLMPMVFAWIHVLLLTPWIRPISLWRLFWTYVVPLAPVAICWDGIVSTLRCYRADELLEMARDADPDEYFDWEAAEYSHRGIFPVTFLIGKPR